MRHTQSCQKFQSDDDQDWHDKNLQKHKGEIFKNVLLKTLRLLLLLSRFSRVRLCATP